MKRILSAGILALLGVLACEQQASAWINFKFRVGVAWHWQSGGNSLLWGLFKNGHPGPEAYLPPYPPQGGLPHDMAGMAPQGPYDFQSSYAMPQGAPGAGHPHMPLIPSPQTVPTEQSGQRLQPQDASAFNLAAYYPGYYQGWYYPQQNYYNPYQLVSYAANAQTYQPTGSVYYPFTAYYPGNTWANYYSYPWYWYGR